MSKSNATENDVLAYIFNRTTMPDYGTSTGTILHVALHTADPGEAGTQATSEATYTGYLRVAVNRNSGGWTVTGSTVSNTGTIQFPQCTGGNNTISHVSIGVASGTTAGQILYSGALNANLSVSNLIQPQFGPGALVISED
jgi:hypothetical protein